jgi:hypothetical protein
MEHQEKINLNKAIEIFKDQDFEVEMTKPNKKFKKFENSKNSVIYLILEKFKENNMKMYIHPDIDMGKILLFEGVEKIGEEWNFHSNMTAFPKRLNKGKNEITYGWQVTCTSLFNLEKFLISYGNMNQ